MNELATTQPEQVQERAIVNYENISAKPLSKDQCDKIPSIPNIDLVKKRPDGMFYVDGIHYRRVLDEVFGVAGWALRPINSTMYADPNGKSIKVFVQGQLWAEGRFISESVGEDTYYLNNGNDSYATAWEKAKSNLLVRCCKELGVYRSLWDKEWLDTNKPAILESIAKREAEKRNPQRATKQEAVTSIHEEMDKPTEQQVVVKSCETLEEVLKKSTLRLKSSDIPKLRKKYTGVADLTAAPLAKVREYLNVLIAKQKEVDAPTGFDTHSEYMTANA